MKKILSVNAGSSSLKFKLFEMPVETVITEGVIERIGSEEAGMTIKFNGEKVKKTLSIKDHNVAVELLISNLTDLGIIEDLNEIKGLGHRVVHGGEKFVDSAVINDRVLKDIDDLSDLAPLHNPANLTGINAFKRLLPDVPAVAVFDTSFHQTMDEEAYMYATPYEWYENYGVRKYGFHGTSHKYVSGRAASILGKEDAKVIVCHLGNGASLCAVDGGKSIDTSMGLTPLEGLVMGTRSGNIDPAVIEFIEKKENKTIKEITHDLNKKSGFLGISGISNDSRDIEEHAEKGHKRAKLAQDMFVRRICGYIAQYNLELEGADAICFTAGIGENSALVREEVMKRLAPLGVTINHDANKLRGEEKLISTEESSINCYIIPTDEELMIARDVVRLTNK
ncbi:acetate/propionate family kinase [Haloplasma contractile]|uniref:Acetate kinase n=1 Tax=Haloplasma contractile SSD-17B TaxID=1033810 RepID=U2FKR4_9MOLU|nr:acetate kinase [Haloplasma contractile]ERJ11809.1 Acetate kinase protein [Haloplasma contractile SSD-17B]